MPVVLMGTENCYRLPMAMELNSALFSSTMMLEPSGTRNISKSGFGSIQTRLALSTSPAFNCSGYTRSGM